MIVKCPVCGKVNYTSPTPKVVGHWPDGGLAPCQGSGSDGVIMPKGPKI